MSSVSKPDSSHNIQPLNRKERAEKTPQKLNLLSQKVVNFSLPAVKMYGSVCKQAQKSFYEKNCSLEKHKLEPGKEFTPGLKQKS